LQSNIINFYQLSGVKLGQSKSREFITHYIQTGIIWKNPYVKGYEKYQKNPKFIGFSADEFGTNGITAKERESPF
jgi:hypothetical protein